MKYTIDTALWPKLKKFLKQIKGKKIRDLDERFSQLHDEVFTEIDCLACANCCKTTSPIFLETDIKQLSKYLGMNSSEFIENYLFRDTDGLYALKKSPCTFLEADNNCSVYEARPKACREYPHTNQRKMHNKLNLAAENLAICPAVNRIVARLSMVNG